MNKLQAIRDTATKATIERLNLIHQVRELIDSEPGIVRLINSIDGSFVRKLKHFPGDITTCRIAKVFTKVNQEILK